MSSNISLIQAYVTSSRAVYSYGLARHHLYHYLYLNLYCYFCSNGESLSIVKCHFLNLLPLVKQQTFSLPLSFFPLFLPISLSLPLFLSPSLCSPLLFSFSTFTHSLCLHLSKCQSANLHLPSRFYFQS